MKILIAGGAGFLGSHLTKYFLKKYPAYQIIVLDNLASGSLDNLRKVRDKKNFQFVQADVTDVSSLAAVFGQKKPQAVINAVFDDAPQTAVKTMVQGNFWLLEQARQAGVNRFIYLGSDEVYGEMRGPQQKLRRCQEADPLKPQTPLSAAQAGADLMTLAFFRAYALPSLVLRVGNVIGPSSRTDRLVPLLITQAIKNKPLPIYGDGKHLRCFLPLFDFLRAVDLALHKKQAVGEVFNVSSDQEHQILELVELILGILGKPKDLISFVKDQKPHTLRRTLDAQKIKDKLGWRVSTDFNLALSETIRHYQNSLA